MGFADKLKDAVSGSGAHGGSNAGTGQTSEGAGVAAGGAKGSSGHKDYGDKGVFLRIDSFSP
jgi:hypothetical protein